MESHTSRCHNPNHICRPQYLKYIYYLYIYIYIYIYIYFFPRRASSPSPRNTYLLRGLKSVQSIDRGGGGSKQALSDKVTRSLAYYAKRDVVDNRGWEVEGAKLRVCRWDRNPDDFSDMRGNYNSATLCTTKNRMTAMTADVKGLGCQWTIVSKGNIRSVERVERVVCC